jgi:hypothetical protein
MSGLSNSQSKLLKRTEIVESSWWFFLKAFMVSDVFATFFWSAHEIVKYPCFELKSYKKSSVSSFGESRVIKISLLASIW